MMRSFARILPLIFICFLMVTKLHGMEKCIFESHGDIQELEHAWALVASSIDEFSKSYGFTDHDLGCSCKQNAMVRIADQIMRNDFGQVAFCYECYLLLCRVNELLKKHQENGALKNSCQKLKKAVAILAKKIVVLMNDFNDVLKKIFLDKLKKNDSSFQSVIDFLETMKKIAVVN